VRVATHSSQMILGRTCYYYICLSFCLSACTTQNLHDQIHQIFVHVACPLSRSSFEVIAMRYTLYFCFCGCRHVFIGLYQLTGRQDNYSVWLCSSECGGSRSGRSLPSWIASMLLLLFFYSAGPARDVMSVVKRRYHNNGRGAGLP